MTLVEFLTYVAAGGSVVVFSFFAERWNWFQAQTANVKQYLTYGFSAVLSFAAYAAVTYLDPSVLAALAPYFTMLSVLYGSIFVGQVFHIFDKKTTGKG